jgi:5'-nucleotidase
VYQAPAYPATLVTLVANGALGSRPDMVLAGVNHGANTGIGVVHSATVGAALTAGLAGIPALAVSVGRQSKEVRWTLCEQVVAAVVAALALEPVPPGGALNVNLPAAPPTDPAGVAWRSLATFGTAVGRLERRTEPGGATAVRMVFDQTTRELDADGDSGALLRGEVTLTWLALPHAPRPDAGWRGRLLERIRDRWPRGGSPAAEIATGHRLVGSQPRHIPESLQEQPEHAVRSP